MYIARHIGRLNQATDGKLSELWRIANGYPDGSFKQNLAVLSRLVTPLEGDRDLWYICQGLNNIDPEYVRGPSGPTGPFLLNGPYGPMSAFVRLAMIKYGLYAIATLSAYTIMFK